MKDNLNIEELFKSKFEGFEANVDPSLWTNIQQGIGANSATTAAVSTGLSGLSKVAIITGVLAVTATSIWYFNDNTNVNVSVEKPVETNNEEIDNSLPYVQIDEVLFANDSNDPVVEEHTEKINQDLKDIQINPDDIDDDFVNQVLGGIAIEKIEGIDDNNNTVVNNDNNVVVDNAPIENVEQPEVIKPLKFELLYELNKKDLKASANAKNYTKIVWDLGDGNTAYGNEINHTYERPGKYELIVEVQGKKETKSKMVEVVVESTSSIVADANVITPLNKDGRNDYFFIESNEIKTFYISIRNSKGQEVFTSNDPNFQWNGESLDGSIELGNYIYVIIAEGEDGTIFKEQKKLILIN